MGKLGSQVGEPAWNPSVLILKPSLLNRCFLDRGAQALTMLRRSHTCVLGPSISEAAGGTHLMDLL